MMCSYAIAYNLGVERLFDQDSVKSDNSDYVQGSVEERNV